MRKIEVTRRKIDLESFKVRGAVESDYSELIAEDCALYEDGELILLYVLPEEPVEELRAACNQISFSRNTRNDSGKMATTSAVFGFEPRKPFRKDFCSATAMARTHPTQFAALMAGGTLVAKYYSKHHPDLYARHAELSEENLIEQYRIEGMPFTSGIVNKNNPLKYHYDAGNYKSVWSGMVTLKDGIDGGHLALPEFELGIELRDRSLFMFDGQGILHGVTPIRRRRVDAVRYTIVYYSLQQMWRCQTIDEELIRARERQTRRETFGYREKYIEERRARIEAKKKSKKGEGR